MKVAFDWDGTLVHHGSQEPIYEDPAALRLSTRPIPEAMWAAKQLARAGHGIYVVTGRSHVVRKETLRQIRAWLTPYFLEDNLRTQEAFTGYEDMRRFKARCLNEIQPAYYVGDHEADKLAAMDAFVPFHDARTWPQATRLALAVV